MNKIFEKIKWISFAILTFSFLLLILGEILSDIFGLIYYILEFILNLEIWGYVAFISFIVLIISSFAYAFTNKG